MDSLIDLTNDFLKTTNDEKIGFWGTVAFWTFAATNHELAIGVSNAGGMTAEDVFLQVMSSDELHCAFGSDWKSVISPANKIGFETFITDLGTIQAGDEAVRRFSMGFPSTNAPFSVVIKGKNFPAEGIGFKFKIVTYLTNSDESEKIALAPPMAFPSGATTFRCVLRTNQDGSVYKYLETFQSIQPPATIH